ncbi:hypothetical protein E3N88_14437 [Mikania micrantha]|uniref:Uncharacterized protein n=1 Tax=Mikania micrantha TaxID=192012 RepID=A0A5N6P2R6_9ASTR|nr:hypothetical protein E3N88_14437 [Mikania micrantha]
MTSSQYAMRKKFTFAIREGFRGFPACFVHRDTRCDFELFSAETLTSRFIHHHSTIFEAGELSRSLRKHLGSIGGLESLDFM